MKPFEVEVLEKSIEQKGNMLKGCYDDDLFKSWSGDLQKRFPNGSWKTVNGAKVFVNGGKVVAGLDGFNGEIDKFFDGKRKKEDSSKENSEKRERTKRRVELAEKMLQSIPGFSYNNRKLEEICAKDFITEGDFVMQRGDEKLYYEDDALVTKKDGKEVQRIERKNLTPEQQEEIFCLWAGKKAQTATGM